MPRTLRTIRRLTKRSPSKSVGGGGARSPIITLSASSIAENAANNTTIGNLAVANGSGSYVFTLLDDASGKFSISTAALKKAAALDYETATSHNVTVQADNSVDTPITRVFTISVTNVLEVTLSALTLSASNIDDGAAEDTIVGSIQNKSSGSTIALIDSAGSRFKISGTNIVAGSVPTNHDLASSHSITIRETHSDGNNSPRDTILTINVVADLLAAVGAPELTWDTGGGDNTPQFTVIGDLVLGDDLVFYISDDVGFSSPTIATATIDATADANDTLDYVIGPLADGDYWVKCRINRPGHVDGDFSNVENKTVALGGPTGTVFDDATLSQQSLDATKLITTCTAGSGGGVNGAETLVTHATSSGDKVWVEFTIGQCSNVNGTAVGLVGTAYTPGQVGGGGWIGGGNNGGSPNVSFGYWNDGHVYWNGSQGSLIGVYSEGDVIGFEFDLTATNHLEIFLNGVSVYSAGIPINGSDFAVAASVNDIGDVVTMNAGQNAPNHTVTSGFTPF